VYQLNSYYTVYQLNSYYMYSKLWAGSIMQMRLNMYKMDKTVYTKKNFALRGLYKRIKKGGAYIINEY